MSTYSPMCTITYQQVCSLLLLANKTCSVRTGGFGRMPGLYFDAESEALEHMACLLLSGLTEAVGMKSQVRESKILRGIRSLYPLDGTLQQ
jgi:hypothetical protein